MIIHLVYGALIAILLLLLLLQWRARRVRSAKLAYIHSKLHLILSEPTREKLLVVTSDPELRPILIEINRLLSENQKVTAQYNRTEQSIRRMLSNISHDLKTPLTVILGYIETLSLDPDMPSEERQRLLERVNEKLHDVLKLIRTFFDLAKLESGDKELPLTRLDINEACRKSMLQFYDTLTSRGFDVDIGIPETPMYAHANEEALERILNNLISNAIHHGGDGQAIGIRTREEEGFILIEVWDRGKGIQELHRDRVFERMYTMEDSRNKSFEGSGLGLTITKRLVEHMGGAIHLDSKPYEKTVFTIRLRALTY